jgi:hypothetical protein
MDGCPKPTRRLKPRYIPYVSGLYFFRFFTGGADTAAISRQDMTNFLKRLGRDRVNDGPARFLKLGRSSLAGRSGD